MPRMAWRVRASFSISAKRTKPSPNSPKPMPGDTETFASRHQFLGEFQRAECCIGFGNFRPDIHRGFRLFDHPSGFVQAFDQHIAAASGKSMQISRDAILRAFQRRNRRDLNRREGAVIVIALDARQRVDQRFVADHETDAPARHVVAFAHREKFDRDVFGARHLHNAGAFPAIEADIGISEIMHDINAVFARQRDDALEEIQLDALAGRIGGEIEDQHFGFRDARDG